MDPAAPVVKAAWKTVQVGFDAEAGGLAMVLRLDAPEVRIDLPLEPAPQAVEIEPEDVTPDERFDPFTGGFLPQALREIVPVDVRRVEIRGARILVVDPRPDPPTAIRLRDFEISIENLTTRKRFMDGRPVLVTARATVQDSGVLTVFLTADPWGRGLNFSGRAAIRNLAMADVGPLVAAAAGLTPRRGEISVYVSLESQQGLVRGGIKPVLADVRVAPADEGLWTRIKSFLANMSMRLFSDRVPERRAVATVVPIEGDLTEPNIQIWPTVMGVFYNAFVTGIAAGFGGLPPAEFDERTGRTRQVMRVIVGRRRPRAQPTEGQPTEGQPTDRETTGDQPSEDRR